MVTQLQWAMGEGKWGTSFLSHVFTQQTLPGPCSMLDPVLSTGDTGTARPGPLLSRVSKSPWNGPKPDMFPAQQVQNPLHLQGRVCCTHDTDAPQKQQYMLNLYSLNQLWLLEVIPLPDDPLEKPPSTFFPTPEQPLALSYLHNPLGLSCALECSLSLQVPPLEPHLLSWYPLSLLCE